MLGTEKKARFKQTQQGSKCDMSRRRVFQAKGTSSKGQDTYVPECVMNIKETIAAAEEHDLR